MKILYLHESVSGVIKGSGFLTHNNCTRDALRKIGHEIIAVDDCEVIDHKGIDRHRKFYRRMKDKLPMHMAIIPRDIYDIFRDRFIYRKKIEKLVKEGRPDIIYERFTPLHTTGIKVAKHNNIPVIMEVHGPWEEKGQYFSVEGFPWYSKIVYRNALLGADALIVVSNAMKNYLVKWGVNINKINVIPNAVDPEIFLRSSGDQVIKIKDNFKLHGKKVVGFIGSMAPYHGVEYIIEAATKIVNEQNNVAFLLIGPFDKEETKKIIIAKINNYNLTDRFILTGIVSYSQVPAWIDCIDICVMADSNWYGSPIKLFEYGVKGKIVVMPRLSPIEDIILDGHNGILFEPKNSDELAKKVIFAMREDDKVKKMGIELQKEVLANHTWLKNARRIECIASESIRKFSL